MLYFYNRPGSIRKCKKTYLEAIKSPPLIKIAITVDDVVSPPWVITLGNLEDMILNERFRYLAALLNGSPYKNYNIYRKKTLRCAKSLDSVVILIHHVRRDIST